MNEIKASIFIPTKNAGNELFNTLNQIKKQKTFFEILIVDSGSTDNTLKIAEKFRKLHLKIHKISPEEFSHGKTRNLSLKLSDKNSEFIVFLSQDAVPLNENWLSHLLGNFKDKKVAGVFSRQIPRKNANEIEKFFYNYYFPDKKITRPNANLQNFPDNVFFSNVSSCIRKSVLNKYPFNNKIIMSEDQQWSKNILDKYKTVYEPKSIVIHSHNYNLKQTFHRYFDSAFSLNQINKNFRNLTKTGSLYMIKEFKYILNKKPSLIPYLILNNVAKILATSLALRNLPTPLRKKLSMHKYYWRHAD